MSKKILIGIIPALLLSINVYANETTDNDTTNHSTYSHQVTGDFNDLSNGNQKIAKSIFGAQEDGNQNNLSLSDIVSRKQSGEGWGAIYNDLYKQGLVEYRNLGQAKKAYRMEHYKQTTQTGRTYRQGYKQHKKYSDGLTLTNGSGNNFQVNHNRGGRWNPNHRNHGKWNNASSNRGGHFVKPSHNPTNIQTARGTSVRHGGKIRKVK